MGIGDFLRRFREGSARLQGRVLGGSRRNPTPLRVRETTLGLPDPDWGLPGHQNFRRAGGGASVRRIPDGELRRASTKAWDEGRNNPTAKRLLEIRADFMIGVGMRPVTKSEELQAFLNDFFDDKVNRLTPERQHELAVSLRRDGELLAEPLVNPVTGRTRVLWHDQALITEVYPHAKFVTEPGRIKLGRPGADGLGYIVAPGDPELPWDKIPAEAMKVFYFRANGTVGALRGLSDLHALLEYLQTFDNVNFAMVERILVAMTYIWALRGKASKPEINEILNVLATGKPGDSIHLRDTMSLEALFPDIKSGDFSEHHRTFKNVILGSLGVPEGWFGDADAANRASLVAQGDPIFRTLTRLQAGFAEILHTVCEFAVDRALEAGWLSASAASSPFEISADPVAQKDEARISDILLKLQSNLDYAVQIKAITAKEAALTYRRYLSGFADLGAELPDELSKLFEAPERIAPTLPGPAGPEPNPDADGPEGVAQRESFRAALRRHLAAA